MIVAHVVEIVIAIVFAIVPTGIVTATGFRIAMTDSRTIPIATSHGPE
jgi:hypothetical protein